MDQFHSNLPALGGNTGGQYDIGSFDFHGDRVIVLSNDTGNWAVLGQLCHNLTLDTNGQRQMIERKSWSAGRTCVTHVRLPGDDRPRQHFLIHERIVPMWLANITSSRIEDEQKREKIDRAQIELADALYEYVVRRSVVRREPSKLEVARDLVAALEAKEALEAVNKVLAPKAGKWDAFLNAEGLIGMREMADLLKTDVRTMTNWLAEINIFRRQVSRHGGGRNIPRTPHQTAGRFVVKMETNNGVNFPVVYATAHGLDLVADLWEQRTVVKV